VRYFYFVFVLWSINAISQHSPDELLEAAVKSDIQYRSAFEGKDVTNLLLPGKSPEDPNANLSEDLKGAELIILENTNEDYKQFCKNSRAFDENPCQNWAKFIRIENSTNEELNGFCYCTSKANLGEQIEKIASLKKNTAPKTKAKTSENNDSSDILKATMLLILDTLSNGSKARTPFKLNKNSEFKITGDHQGWAYKIKPLESENTYIMNKRYIHSYSKRKNGENIQPDSPSSTSTSSSSSGKILSDNRRKKILDCAVKTDKEMSGTGRCAEGVQRTISCAYGVSNGRSHGYQMAQYLEARGFKKDPKATNPSKTEVGCFNVYDSYARKGTFSSHPGRKSVQHPKGCYYIKNFPRPTPKCNWIPYYGHAELKTELGAISDFTQRRTALVGKTMGIATISPNRYYKFLGAYCKK